MPKTIIYLPDDPGMSLEASAVIFKMANMPEANNCTAKELNRFFVDDSMDVIQKALHELCHKKYVIEHGGVYTVNRKMMQPALGIA